MSTNMSVESTVIKAWYIAVGNRPINQGLIFHSDRGSQCACSRFINTLKSYELVEQSISRKGNCWDNAVAERFFRSLKTEWAYKKTYLLKTDADISILNG